MHPALQLSHGISSDILPSVYNWLFSHDVFKRWCEGDGAWQLHCIGGPGVGKTTLTALVAQQLETHFPNNDHSITTIFVDYDVPDHEIELIEDILVALYRNLENSTLPQDDDSEDLYEEYAQERYSNAEGSRIRDRLKLIRTALHSRLVSLQSCRTFLLIDGIDRCGPTLRYMLGTELSNIRGLGVHVFSTSRLAVFEQREARCDHRDHGQAPDADVLSQADREILDVFLVCRACDSVLCFGCEAVDRLCEDCDDNSQLYEPYDHVNIRVSVPDPSMKEYIAWNLEREHGDLGLGSSAHKPPLSTFGKSIRSTTSNSIQKHVDNVLDYSYGHIGLAKARLDLIHEAGSLDGLEMRRDQLPANIVTLFDLGLKRIEAQTATQRDVAVKALAAAARSDDGISIPELRELLHMLGTERTRSGEEIVEAARGFLLATTRDDPQRLTVFHQSFLYYVEQRYHRAIHRASMQVDASVFSSPTSPAPEISDAANKVRFEPQTVSEQPTKVTPYKLSRTTTIMQTIDETPARAIIFRKGTQAWQ
ncbi:hypothetical protein P153DRAFT_308924 [Dothidotthia symphoricarpi CBS 119687]|uniref:Nephrocystin 3-like N-terminal domain-containing protein n=1 Tax=Dothidotthia symphoricarpi CBS 119687 TaxID=1392245 RepID=A0A6A6AMY6_9PLEO|nr:uncharacterized protein P153DRAFT_308924 [Dothidotthia symphoricarpi CBS 119687]KAF2132543.1 hypothetical protein P153DRAFT_308924 [Dothidotthia symphoricarpi CBS 119687]